MCSLAPVHAGKSAEGKGGQGRGGGSPSPRKSPSKSIRESAKDVRTVEPESSHGADDEGDAQPHDEWGEHAQEDQLDEEQDGNPTREETPEDSEELESAPERDSGPPERGEEAEAEAAPRDPEQVRGCMHERLLCGDAMGAAAPRCIEPDGRITRQRAQHGVARGVGGALCCAVPARGVADPGAAPASDAGSRREPCPRAEPPRQATLP